VSALALPAGALPASALGAGAGAKGAKAGSAATTPASSTPLAPAGSTSPFSPGVPQSPASTPTSTATTPIVSPTTTTSSNNGGLSGTGIIVIVIAAVVLLVGVAVFVMRDARRHAPGKHRSGSERADERSKPGSKRPPKARKLSAVERKRRKRGRAR
jgi:hypothetical protein